MYPSGKSEKDAIYTAEGHWNKEFTMSDAKTKKVIDEYQASKYKTTPLTVAPLEQQDDLESRKAWSKVASAINKGDMDTTGREKTAIENSQRELRKKEAAEGREWNRRFFSKTDKHPAYDVLAKQVGETIQADQTGGVWEFDQAKAREAKPPFHQQS